MSIGNNEIEVGVGVDQGWFGTVLPEVLLWLMPSRLSRHSPLLSLEPMFQTTMGPSLLWPIKWKAISYGNASWASR